MKSLKICAVIAAMLILAFGIWYMFPGIALSGASLGFWFILGILLLLATVVIYLIEDSEPGEIDYLATWVFGIIAGIIIVLPLIIGLFNTSMFRAKSYSKLITVEEGVFAEDIPSPLDTDIMDTKTAINIGSRVMGQIDNVSQYVISEEYNMITYQGKTYRVSPLEYASFSRAWGNKGISGYVLVDCATQEATLVKLDEKMYYSPSAVFSKNLTRHVRFAYPSALLGKAQFEIDEEGKPYYIIPTYKNKVGPFSGKVLKNVLVVNATDGKITEYSLEDLPEWIDHADSVSHLMDLTTDHYQYVNGFLNTMFAKKDVRNLSYIYKDQDFTGYSSIKTNKGIEYFTGVTSANNDESLLGFVFLNPRDGKITFYNCVGAEESSAQNSAEALVQNFGYNASYPFVVNVDGIETYLISLKDKTGVNKAYSFVNVKNYTISTQASTKEEALNLYKKKLSGKLDASSQSENESVTAKIQNIYTVVEDSTTYFYYKLEGHDELFVSSVLTNRYQVEYKVGDTVKVECILSSGYYKVLSIELAN